jgi:hypothetical protein
VLLTVTIAVLRESPANLNPKLELVAKPPE